MPYDALRSTFAQETPAALLKRLLSPAPVRPSTPPGPPPPPDDEGPSPEMTEFMNQHMGATALPAGPVRLSPEVVAAATAPRAPRPTAVLEAPADRGAMPEISMAGLHEPQPLDDPTARILEAVRGQQARPGFDLNAELGKLGAPPERPAMPTRAEKSKYSLLPEILAGLGDVAAAAGRQRTDYLGKVQQIDQFQRDQKYQDDLAHAAAEYDKGKADWGWKLQQLGMRQADAAAGEARDERAKHFGLEQERFNLAKQGQEFEQGQIKDLTSKAAAEEKKRLSGIGALYAEQLKDLSGPAMDEFLEKQKAAIAQQYAAKPEVAMAQIKALEEAYKAARGIPSPGLGTMMGMGLRAIPGSGLLLNPYPKGSQEGQALEYGGAFGLPGAYRTLRMWLRGGPSPEDWEAIGRAASK